MAAKLCRLLVCACVVQPIDATQLALLQIHQNKTHYGLAFHGGGTRDLGNAGVKTAHAWGMVTLQKWQLLHGN